MNHQFDDAEWLAQERARGLERDGAPLSGERREDRYRIVFRALKQAARTPLPMDFAAGVLRRTAQFEREDAAERWVLRAVSALVGVGLALYVGPMILDALAASLRSAPAPGAALGMLRSPLLWSAVLAAAAAALVDKGWSRR